MQRLIPYLPVSFLISSKLVAIGALISALCKLFTIAQQWGWLTAFTFTGMHLPLCVFSSLFVLSFSHAYPLMTWLALVSTVMNALLI